MSTMTLERPTRRTRVTLEEFEALPDVKPPYCVVDGEVIELPSPSYQHQWCVGSLVILLTAFVQPRQIGIVMAAPADIVIQRSPLRIREPDVMFFSRARTG